MNFVAMDFETASRQPYSACSLMLVMVKNSQIVDEFCTLIQSKTPFFWRNVQIRKIHQEDVCNAPRFSKVRQTIQPYFQKNRLVAAHNAAFDTKVLAGCLDYYHLEQPNHLSLYTVKSNHRLFPEFLNHRLNTVCRSLNIQLDHHHDALEDSRAYAETLLYQEKKFGTDSLKKLVTIKQKNAYETYKEVMSLPFYSESQRAVSRDSFPCLLDIVTGDRGAGRRTPLIKEVMKKLFCIK